MKQPKRSIPWRRVVALVVEVAPEEAGKNACVRQREQVAAANWRVAELVSLTALVVQTSCHNSEGRAAIARTGAQVEEVRQRVLLESIARRLEHVEKVVDAIALRSAQRAGLRKCERA